MGWDEAIELCCEKCGFVALLPSVREAHLSGWSNVKAAAGTAVCPLCTKDPEAVPPAVRRDCAPR